MSTGAKKATASKSTASKTTAAKTTAAKTTAAKSTASSPPDEGQGSPDATAGILPPTPPANDTRLDSYVDAPSSVAPGDAPHDTTDPTERASTVSPDKATAAAAGHGTVNSAVPIPAPKTRRRSGEKREDRVETYIARKENGDEVEVEHNIDTGATKVIG